MLSNVANTTVLAGERVTDNKPQTGSGSSAVTLSGFCQGNRCSVSLTNSHLSRHTLLMGGTGCGKTNTIKQMIKQLKRNMTANDVMIIFDTKGDYYRDFFDPRKDCLIGNSSQFRNVSEKWNIYREIVIDGADWTDIEGNAREISMSLFAEAIEGNSSNPFFPLAAQDVFATLMQRFIKDVLKDKSLRDKKLHNRYLKTVLDTADIEILNLLLMDPQFNSVCNYLGSSENLQGLGVIAEMQNVIRRVLCGVFAEAGTFSVRDFVRKRGGRSLFIEYDLSMGNVLTPMYRILFDLALKEAMRQKSSDGSASIGNVYFICDEFKLLPLLQHIEDAVNFGRSLGVKVIAGIQSIQQITQIYGEERGKNILAGFSTMIAFKPNDYESRKYISDLFGKNYLFEQYRGTGTSFTGREREGRTVEDWDISHLDVGQAIVAVDMKAPYIFKFDCYDSK